MNRPSDAHSCDQCGPCAVAFLRHPPRFYGRPWWKVSPLMLSHTQEPFHLPLTFFYICKRHMLLLYESRWHGVNMISLTDKQQRGGLSAENQLMHWAAAAAHMLPLITHERTDLSRFPRASVFLRLLLTVVIHYLRSYHVKHTFAGVQIRIDSKTYDYSQTVRWKPVP